MFAGNAFFLNRDHAVSPEEEIQIHASGDNEHIEGRWKNPTGYRIENAILVLTNRIVFLGDLEPGEEGTFSEKIHSYGNGGLEKILRKYLDLKDTEYPDYAVNAVTEQGTLHWLDKVGNRIAPVAFGPRKVIIVAGRNKIVADRDEAEERIRRIAAPQNVARHPGFRTPCA